MKKQAQKITVSAPGKLMLFGEHAVVYGRPCIVTAVGQRMRATVELTQEPIFQLNAADVQIKSYQKPITKLGKGDIPKGAKFVEMAVNNFTHARRGLAKLKGKGIKVTTKSEFSSQFGFGSSSAATVCVIKALSELTGIKLSNEQIFDLSYKAVLDIQGKGSGFDVAAATFGGTLFYQLKQTPSHMSGLYFVTGGKTIKPLKLSSLPLIVGYSKVKTDTVTMIDEVSKKAKKFPKIIDNIYSSIGDLVKAASQALAKADFEAVGVLMDVNEGYLVSLGVEGEKLSSMIYAARSAGAYGAKLSGAGRGDCMIALAPTSKVSAVKKAINVTGGQVINVKTNAEGVKIE